MSILSPYLPIITLNENRLNSAIKRHRVAEWIKKQYPTIYRLQETHFSFKDTHRLKVKVWKKDIPFKWKAKESRGSYTYIKTNRL